jgi:hypothetical protein
MGLGLPLAETGAAVGIAAAAALATWRPPAPPPA